LSNKNDGFLFRWTQRPAFDLKTKHAFQAEAEGSFSVLKKCHGYGERRNGGSEHFIEISEGFVVMREDALGHGQKAALTWAS